MTGKEKEIKSNPEFDKVNSFLSKFHPVQQVCNPYINSIPVTV